MAAERQELLRDAWLGGASGNLSALSEARAWALREIWVSDGKPDYGMHTYIAERVTKVGGGCPGRNCIRKFFEKIDGDANWHPGKTTREVYGPASVFLLCGDSQPARRHQARTRHS